MTRRPFLASLLTIAAAWTSLAACGSPSFEYVRNTEAKTAFKVPHEWTLFDEAVMQGDPSGVQASTPDTAEWLVGLDADPSPAREHVLSLDGGYDTAFPQGIAGVFGLSTLARDRVDLEELRNLLIPIDQILDEVDVEAVSMIAYDDRLDVDGFRGLHLEAQISMSALETVVGIGGGAGSASVLVNDDYLHINQTAYIDSGTDKVYLLAVLCSADCYARNHGDIETVVGSWAVIA